jgi:hypothetical protein
MSVRRFRDASEIPEPWEDRSERLFRAIRRTWKFAARTVPVRFPPGVHRHRSIEEADAQRERWADDNFAAFQRGRGR